MDRVKGFIKNLAISKDEFIVVACSGGPDSIFLLKLLHDLGYKCVCAHVNHNVREASRDEYTFLNEFCNSNNIIFEGVKIESYDTNLNFHEYAREFRYNFFKDLVEKYNSKYVFTAHHGDDLIETIMMRLVRSSSLRGYAGFSKIVCKDGYKIVRPLVYLTKDEILQYDIDNNIKFVTDESNLEDHYTRNRYRHHLLPFLKQEEKNVHTKFLSYSETLYECMDYIDSIVNQNLSEIFVDNSINLSKFNKLELFLKKQMLETIMRKYYIDNLYLINKVHIDDIVNICSGDKSNVIYSLPDGLKVVKEYDKLIFSRDLEDKNAFKYEFDEYLEINNHIFKKIDDTNDKSNYVIKLNSNDIKLPLFFRSKKEGDFIHVKNMNGNKKINKIFIDEKVPLRQRDNYPLLVDSDDNILWVPGLKKSEKDIQNDKEYDIIIKYEKRRDINE